ncbi:hypothetical protein V6N11_079992 [Hibiscus sabdariffa]|uniref:Uncharacterized protein n=1 Tax=Hibiscus sabdariffa TaxID=183260 RepID=A0ABR2RXH8_9ROSI
MVEGGSGSNDGGGNVGGGTGLMMGARVRVDIASMEVRQDGSEEKDGDDLVSVGEGELAVSSNYGLKSAGLGEAR